MSKYGNRKTQIDGITFDSQAEARRYQELRLLERAHHVSDLDCQPVLELQPKFKRDGKWIAAITYRADFAYTENGRRVIEDVKGGKATRTALFNVKWKMAQYKYPEYVFRLEMA